MPETTVTLNEVLNYHHSNSMAGVHTAIPAIVISVDDLSRQRITVQPAINIRTEDGTTEAMRPPIINVPLHMPVTKMGGLTFPIQAGDCVFLIFSMRGLEVWKRGNGRPQAPSDVRMFDVRDCVAIPGIYPFSQSPNASRSNSHSPQDVVLVHNIGSGSEVEIRLKPNGEVVVNSPVKVTINAPENEINGNVTVNGNFKNDGGSFQVTTGEYSLSATESAQQSGTMSHSGPFILDGTTINDHDHGGVVSGGDRTDPFGS